MCLMCLNSLIIWFVIVRTNLNVGDDIDAFLETPGEAKRPAVPEHRQRRL